MSKAIFASAGDKIKIWDGDDMTLLKEYNYHSENVNNLRWSSNNEHILSTSSKGDKIIFANNNLYKSNKPEVVGVFASGEEQNCAALLNNDSQVVSGGACGELYLHDILSQTVVKKFSDGPSDPIKCLEINDMHNYVITGNGVGELLLWNIETGKFIGKLNGTKSSTIRAIRWNFWKTNSFGSVGDSGHVCLWDINKMNLKYKFSKSHSATAMDLSFSPLNHLLLVSCGLDKKIILHDANGKKEIDVKILDQPLTSVCLTQNGVNLYAGTYLGKIYKFDLRSSSKYTDVLKAHDSSVQCLARQVSPNKRLSRHSKTNVSVSYNIKSDTSSIKNKVNESMSKNSTSSSIKDNQISQPVINNLQVNTPLSNGHSPVSKSSLLRQTLGNTFSSSRDSMGSYCEDFMSPLRKDSMSPTQSKTNTPHQQILSNSGTSSIVAPSRSLTNQNNFETPKLNFIEPTKRDARKSSTPMNSNLQSIIENADAHHDNVFSNSKDNIDKEKLLVDKKSFEAPSKSFVNGDANFVSHEVLTSALKAQSDIFITALKQQSESLLAAMQLHAEDLHEKNVNSHNHHLREVSKLLFKQQQKIKEMIEQGSLNPVLVSENEQLRLENESLRKFF